MKSHNPNGMSWLLLQVLVRILDNAGGDVHTKIHLTLLLADCVWALVQEPELKEAREVIADERKVLAIIRDRYDPMYEDKYSFSERGQYESEIDDAMRNILVVAASYNLINPSLLKEAEAGQWGSVEKIERGVL